MFVKLNYNLHRLLWQFIICTYRLLSAKIDLWSFVVVLKEIEILRLLKCIICMQILLVVYIAIDDCLDCMAVYSTKLFKWSIVCKNEPPLHITYRRYNIYTKAKNERSFVSNSNLKASIRNTKQGTTIVLYCNINKILKISFLSNKKIQKLQLLSWDSNKTWLTCNFFFKVVVFVLRKDQQVRQPKLSTHYR